MKKVDPKLIEEAMKKLLEEEQRVKSELGEVTVDSTHDEGSEHEARFTDIGRDNTENATEVDEYVKNLATEDTLDKELEDIQGALKRIADGAFGICKFCKQPIEVGRLKIRPTSSSCVKCKEKLQDNPDKSIKELFGDV
jgi:RNA polymerase-binding protein DksA